MTLKVEGWVIKACLYFGGMSPITLFGQTKTPALSRRFAAKIAAIYQS